MKIIQYLACLLISVASVNSAAAQHKMLLRDEGMSKLSYVDTNDPSKDWQVEVPPGRDLQLVGEGKVLIGTATGYEEREIETGKKVFETTAWQGCVAARRLSNGNTMLLGVDWQGKEGIVLVELNKKYEVVNIISYPGHKYARLFRQTTKSTFIITADKFVIEGDRKGKVIWKATVEGHDSPHAWQAVRRRNGETVVSTGYPSNLQIFSKGGVLLRTINGPDDANPHFFSGFQVMKNGNIIVANWQGHGPSFGSVGIQLLEFSPRGGLVWSWKQDPLKFSSLQGVIVLDGLDVSKLHVENDDGVLVPK